MTTEGNVIHYGFIEKFIENLGERFNIREIAFDRWGAVQMVQNLEGMGFTVVPFGQGFKKKCPTRNSSIDGLSGHMTRSNCPMRTLSFRRASRISDSHEIDVNYIFSISV